MSNRQNETVEEYIRDFEILVGQTSGVTDEQLLGYFLGGLQEDVRNRVRPHDPQELMTAMRIARDVEVLPGEAKTLGGGENRPQVSRGRTSGTITRVEPMRNPEGQTADMENVGSGGREGNSGQTAGRGASATENNTMGRGVRNLPYHEYLKRREEGRCFRCGGQFGPGHRCPESSLRVLILGEDEEEDPGENEAEVEHKRLDLSFLSAGGLTQPRTIKLQGSLGDRVVLIMVDSGTSHNFISKALVEELQLEVDKGQTHSVCLGADRGNKPKAVTEG
ncbi:hypothetical protein LR48_Vigan04g088200 [Vigna angularis]|uniref:Retrotransposon gag domain-containing protein n=1 Tax=Phaseolus angularis TaxID=3914 RepID=A0A0L9UDS9_PHAAN|nr:hypothetical protein LR48_Vigan04g088200 [Vigna angularis]